MRSSSRLVLIVSGTAMAAALTACGTAYPTQTVGTYPSTTYPTATYPTTAPAMLEYGRVTNIEFVQGGTTSATNPNATNAVVGGVIGAVVGNMIGKNTNDGKNRTGATVLGGAAGAAIGSQVGKTTTPVTTNSAYRVTVQTDGGIMRTYEVSSTGDLRVGDRVRIENNVIYRS